MKKMHYHGLRSRIIHKPCKCGGIVSFKVWQGFSKVAQHLAAICPKCMKVHLLKGVHRGS